MVMGLDAYTELDEVVDAVYAHEPYWLYNLACEYGQQLDNVKHMAWFRERVFEESQRRW